MERTETTKHGVILRLSTPSASEVRVAAFEAWLGHRLPADYREFLLCHNGGKPTPSVFKFAERSGPGTGSFVRYFLSLYEGQSESLEENCGAMKGRFPEELIPIAMDSFGNFVLLSVEGDTRGKVYFWNHEEEPMDQPAWSNIDLIAETFDKFMTELMPNPHVIA